MSNKIQLLSDILELTREMRSRALESCWEQVQDLEARRHPLVAACFPLEKPDSEQAKVVDWIHEIIDLDRSVISMAAIERDDLGRVLSGINQGKQAAGAYRRMQRGD